MQSICIFLGTARSLDPHIEEVVRRARFELAIRPGTAKNQPVSVKV